MGRGDHGLMRLGCTSVLRHLEVPEDLPGAVARALPYPHVLTGQRRAGLTVASERERVGSRFVDDRAQHEHVAYPDGTVHQDAEVVEAVLHVLADVRAP